MLAARYQPGAVPALFEAIGRLGKAQQVDILSKVTAGGYNALMLAAQYQPSAVPALLEAIGQLDKAQQADILSKVQPQGYNALMLAARYQPGTVSELLKAISQLEEAQQAKILGKVTSNEVVILMCENNHFDGSQLLEVLKTIKGNKNTGVMIKFILKFEKKFSPSDWYTIVNENLIPAERIKHKKEMVYDYIKSLAQQNASGIINDALDKNKDIGKFFYIKRGFFGCNESAGTLKKLKVLKESGPFAGPVVNIDPPADQKFKVSKNKP